MKWKAVKTENKEVKMTSGPVTKSIFLFALPVFLGQILQQLYGIADSVIVGRYLGVDALAAVGATGSLNYIIGYFCIGSCIGISVPLSQAYGAGDKHKLRCYFVNGIYFFSVMAVIITVITACFCMNFLQWLQTPANIINGADTYLSIIFYGLPCTILYNFCFGVLLAFGDSKSSSVFMAISTVLNLILDLVMIVVWEWGIAGAAIATVISQGVAGAASFIYIFCRYKILLPENSEERKLQFSFVKNIISMSMPMGLQYSITAVGAIILQVGVNNLGYEEVAAFSSGTKMKGLFLCPLNALGTALSSFVGQNFGANQLERVQVGVKRTLQMGAVYCLGIIVFAYFFCDSLAGWFVEESQREVIRHTRKFIQYISVFNLELTFLFAYRYSVQGMGYGKYSIYSGLAEMIARSLTAVFLVPVFGFEAVCWSEGITFLAGIFVIAPIYKMLIKRYKGCSTLSEIV